jgi:hypothetical protein
LQSSTIFNNRVAKVSKDVVQGFNFVKNGLLEIGDLCTSLHNLNMDFNQKSEFGKDVIQEKVFFALQNSFVCWSDVFDSQIKHFNTNVHKFFEYWKLELETVREVGLD